ncbi:MAG: hypothetical protein ACREOO_07710 [bacterium]
MLACVLAVFPWKLAAQEAEPLPSPDEVKADSTYKNQISGEFTPGRGFDVVKTSRASLNISAYGLARYINQLPAKQSYVDHLGRTRGRDDRHNQVDQPSPVNQQVKLSDAVLFYETGALAEGVTVQQTDFSLIAIDAGLKYKGLHLQGEYYFRKLADFLADGPLPRNSIADRGFNVSAMYQVLPKLAVYGTNSIVNDDFGIKPWEVAGGLSFYPSGMRSWRLNLHVIRVEKSPAFSQFGFYINGQHGTTISAGTDILL